MTRQEFEERNNKRSQEMLERRKVEAAFNSVVLKRIEAGENEAFIRADLRITRELVNRIKREARARGC